MKKLILIAAAALSSYGAFAQGTLTFANNSTTRIINSTTGAGANNTIRVQLFWADGANANVSTLRSVTNAPISVAASGIFAGSTRRLETSTEGGMATVQVRAWSASLGADYDTARAAWLAGGASPDALLGESAVFNIDTAGVVPNPTPPIPTSLVSAGLTSFTVNPVPEPATIALGALGLLGALFLRRRK